MLKYGIIHMRKEKYAEYITICQNCGSSNISFGKMEDFNIKKTYGSGYCYFCNDCKQYIVTTKGRKKDALGTIADKETKRLRYECHQKFDTLWQGQPSYKRRIYYNKLAKGLGIKVDKCHFGHMDKEMLKEALKVIEDIKKNEEN